MADELRLRAIRERIAELALADALREVFGADRHDYALGRTLAPDELERFERAHGVELPEGLRAYLSNVGSEGVGPYYGLLALPDAPAPGEGSPLARPFIGDAPADSDVLRDPRAEAGYLRLADHGCGYRSVLVLTGPRRGAVFADMREAHEGLTHEAPDFLTWYEDWLDRALAEWASYALPRIIAGSDAGADAGIEAAAPILERRAAASVPTAHDRLYTPPPGRRVEALFLLRIYQRRLEDAAPLIHQVAELAAGEREAVVHLCRARIHAARGAHTERLASASAGLDANPGHLNRESLLREKERALLELGRRAEAIATILERANHTRALHDFYDAAWLELEDEGIEAAARILEDVARRGIGCDKAAPAAERLLACAEGILSALVADEREGIADALRARLAAHRED